MNGECKKKYFSLCIIHYKQSYLLLSVCMCAHVHTHTHRHTHTPLTHVTLQYRSALHVLIIWRPILFPSCETILEENERLILWFYNDFLILVLPKVVALMVKNHPAVQETWALSLGREGNGNPLQHYCLENPMDGGAWEASVHRVTKSWT